MYRYAQFLIGVHYERGFDIAQDLEMAKDYYRKSADGGFPDAQAALGSRLIADLNYAKGIEWLEKAVHMVKNDTTIFSIPLLNCLFV